MSTAIRTPILAEGVVEVSAGGLLSSVRRPCAEHGCEGRCVARCEREGCLVFWCPEGEHPFTSR